MTTVTTTKQFLGKYRGKVTNNTDPLMLGRIKASVPAALGESEESGWALPSAPYAGSGVGFFFIPPVDANVWIEFENGNTDYPVWTGCFWNFGETPAKPGIAYTKMIKTDTATIKLDDFPGTAGITIETATGWKIVMDVTGIEISTGAKAKVKLTPASVSVNDGALEVI